MANVLFASAPNYCEFSDGSLTAGSEASSSYADDNLGNPEPSILWRSSAMHPQATWVRVTPLNYTTYIVGDTYALINHNLREGSGYYRWIGMNTGTGTPGMEALVPTGLVSSSNATGTYTDVDEGYSPDANWITPTTPASAMSVSVSFNTPAATPKTGSNYQCFAVYVRTSDAGSVNRIICYLDESGSPVATLDTKIVSSSSGQWLIWRWDASALGTASGANVECRLVTVPVGSQYIDIGSIVWQSEADSHFATANINFDTGWVAYTQSLGTSLGNLVPEASQPQKIILHQESQVWTNQSAVYCLLSEDHAPHRPVGSLGTNLYEYSDRYVQAGVMSVSSAFQPYVNPRSISVAFQDDSTQGQTVGGVDYGSGGAKRRIFRVPLQLVKPADMVDIAARLDWQKGKRGAFLVSLFPGDSDMQEITTAWVTIGDTGTWEAETTGDEQDSTVVRWSRDYTLREKL